MKKIDTDKLAHLLGDLEFGYLSEDTIVKVRDVLVELRPLLNNVAGIYNAMASTEKDSSEAE